MRQAAWGARASQSSSPSPARKQAHKLERKRRPRGPWRLGEHIEAGALDRPQRGPPAGDERCDGQRRAPAEGADQRRPGVEQRTRAGYLEGEQLAQPRTRGALPQLVLGDVESLEILGGDVDG